MTEWMTQREMDAHERLYRMGKTAIQLGIADEEELTKMARFYHTYAPGAQVAKDGIERARTALHQAALGLRMAP